MRQKLSWKSQKPQLAFAGPFGTVRRPPNNIFSTGADTDIVTMAKWRQPGASYGPLQVGLTS
jgi:hypothetical protein